MWGLQRALAPHTDLAGALIEFCCDPDEFANSPDPDTRTTMWERWLYASGAGHSADGRMVRSEEHTSELQSLMRISYAVFCLKKKIHNHHTSEDSIYTHD